MKARKRPRELTSAGAGPSSRLVVLVGEGPDWPPDMGTLLAREGYLVDRVGQLDAALPLLDGGPVQALLVAARPLAASDLLLLRRIREAAPGTAVVVVTRTPTDPDLKRAFESGATAFLSWPASADALRQAVDGGRGVSPK